MFILIDENGGLSLEQHDNFKGFSIVDRSAENDREALNKIAEAAEDNHYWIEAEAVIALSPSNGDKKWVDDFWKMLASSEPYGYANMTLKQVKAHIEKS